MKIICIDNIDTLYLTIGKCYEIYVFGDFIYLMNDNNNYTYYQAKRFLTLNQYRKIKMQNINDKSKQ